MELHRRDALLALGGLGLTGAAWLSESDDESSLDSDDITDLVALAETLYPSEVTVTAEFVETYALGQNELDPDHTASVASALETVRQQSQLRTGSLIRELPPSRRDDVLRATGADRAYPEPNGTDAEQVRYYVVNNLLYALYTTPKGGELIDNPNPPGHPGGTEAYQEVSADE